MKLPLNRWHIVLFMSATLLLSLACGDSDSADTSETPGAGTSATSTPQQQQGSSDLAPDTGVVTVGNTSYEFNMAGEFADQCLTLFGVVGGGGSATDGSDVSVEFEFPPEDYESNPRYADFDPPSIRVRDDENNTDWQAGIYGLGFTDLPADGESQVDSYTSDGNTASGTATFIDMTQFFMSSTGQAESPTPVQGTFEFYCE